MFSCKGVNSSDDGAPAFWGTCNLDVLWDDLLEDFAHRTDHDLDHIDHIDSIYHIDHIDHTAGIDHIDHIDHLDPTSAAELSRAG